MWEGWSKPLEASGASPAPLTLGGRVGSAPRHISPPLGSSPDTAASMQRRHRNQNRAAALAEQVCRGGKRVFISRYLSFDPMGQEGSG